MENENKTNEETKQVSNEQNNTQNINYNTKSVKKSNTPVLICLIIVILALIGIIVCLVIMNLQNNKVNNVAIDSKNQTEQNTNKDVTNNTNTNINNSTQNVEQKSTEQKIADAYKKYEGMAWVSKNQTVQNKKIIDIKDAFANGAFTVQNGELICNYMRLGKVEFNYGTPKYALGIYNGGLITGANVITEDGKVYVFNNGYNSFNKLDEIKFKEVKINGKVIDMTMGNASTVPYVLPYFLTEEGNLIFSDGRTYEQINKNHVALVGRTYYLNNDGTIEISGLESVVNIYGLTLEEDNYLLLKYENNDRVKAKYLFIATYGSNEGNYVIDNNNELLEFSSKTNYVAKKSALSNGQKVKSVNCDESDEKNKKIEVKLENDQVISFEHIQLAKL